MTVYLRVLGLALIVTGLAGTAHFTSAVLADRGYYAAARALEKYPNHVLYQTEFRMAEPRHMLLLAGAWASAPVGIVLGSLCLGVARILSGQEKLEGAS